MNTAELIKLVANEHGVAKEQVKTILDSVFAAITATAIGGEEVALNGFGRFKLADRAERQGRNSATGETITIAASKKLAFIPAKTVREALSAATAAPPHKESPGRNRGESTRPASAARIAADRAPPAAPPSPRAP
jgi:DNA-binding protein HU-beta